MDSFKLNNAASTSTIAWCVLVVLLCYGASLFCSMIWTSLNVQAQNLPWKSEYTTEFLIRGLIWGTLFAVIVCGVLIWYRGRTT